MELSGTTLNHIMAQTNLDQQPTGPRTLPENGVRNTPIREQKDGPKRRVREVVKNGLKNGIKNVKHFQSRETKKVMNQMILSPTEMKSKNKTRVNGARTQIAMKSGMRSGEKHTDLTSVKNGVTSGKQISQLAKRKEKTGDRHTQRTTW